MVEALRILSAGRDRAAECPDRVARRDRPRARDPGSPGEVDGARVRSSPRLVVWPENAVGFVASANELPLREAAAALPPGGLLLLGAPRSALDGDGHATFRNSAFLVDRQGKVLASHDKRRLTPFAEAWPALLPRPPGTRDAYLPGDHIELLDVDGVRTGVLICSEAIYPDLARDLVREGAELLVNISNDAWFGASPAPTHHLDAARFRAVELRRFLVRSTNTGRSVVVAPSGELIAEIPPGEPGVAAADVVPLAEVTPYARFGDLFAWLCIAVVALESSSGMLRRGGGLGHPPGQVGA